MPNKVSIVLSNPWVDPNTGKVHDVGQSVSVASDLAERLVIGGTGVPATKSDADALPTDVDPATVNRKK